MRRSHGITIDVVCVLLGMVVGLCLGWMVIERYYMKSDICTVLVCKQETDNIDRGSKPSVNKGEKQMKTKDITTLSDYYGDDYERKARRRSQRNRDLADLRDGRRDRSVKFSDARKAQSANACRGKFDWRSELDEREV